MIRFSRAYIDINKLFIFKITLIPIRVFKTLAWKNPATGLPIEKLSAAVDKIIEIEHLTHRIESITKICWIRIATSLELIKLGMSTSRRHDVKKLRFHPRSHSRGRIMHNLAAKSINPNPHVTAIRNQKDTVNYF